MVSCMKLRLGAPIWLNGVRQRRRYPSLQNWQRSDVVIVGGGMTGAGIARVLAEAGVDVALLEGSLVGRGSTAASTALLMQETDEDLRRLEASYGRARASRIWQLSRESVRDLVATLSRLRIACDVQARDTIYYTRNPEKVEDLYAEYQRRRRAGFSARWLDPAALSAVTGIAGEGAIQSRGNAQLDPYRACVGLLNAAAARGARIFESSEVERIEVSRTGVIVRTDGGAIAAGHVIIATGYATPAFALLAGRFTMKHTYVLATEPVTAAERRRLGFGELLLWDTERPYHYARWTPDHRLVLGGNDRVAPTSPAETGLRHEHAPPARILRPSASRVRGNRHRQRLGRTLRVDAGRSAVHRNASPLSATSLRARLRWQWDDLRFPRWPSASRFASNRE
jgi:glycine/D-amino acid oxidase-like deaminating enzyme